MIVEKFLQQDEGKCLEFKQDISSPSKIVNTVVAFANTAGGHLVIGIEDKTKQVVGIEKAHLVEERISASISDAISPQIVPNIEILNWKGLNLITIEVYPGSQKPYFIRSKGENQSTYVRVGSTNRLANSFMIESLRRTHLPTTFDEEMIPTSTIEDLDVGLLTDAFASHKKVTSKELMTLGILKCDNRNQKHLTYGGNILFGKSEQDFLPDAWIHAGCFQGTNKVHIRDSQNIKIPVYTAIDACMSFIRKHLNVAIVVDDIRHREEWSVPQVALREALINAIVHCDYSLSGSPLRISIFDDRIEIENPGILPFGMTLEHMHMGVSKIRNRVLARVFQELKVIEQWGSGIQRIKNACQNAGLKEPVFEEIAYHFRVTLYREKAYEPLLTPQEKNVHNILSKHNGLSTKVIAEKIGLSTRQVRTILIALIDKGMVVEVTRHPNDPDKKYYIK